MESKREDEQIQDVVTGVKQDLESELHVRLTWVKKILLRDIVSGLRA